MLFLRFAGLTALASGLALPASGLALPACALAAVSGPVDGSSLASTDSSATARPSEPNPCADARSSCSASGAGSLPDAPGAAMGSFAGASAAADSVERPPVHAFGGVGIALKVGIGGIGLDLVTPLTPHLNLRGGGSFFNYNTHINTDNIDLGGNLDVRRVDAHLDIYPFHSRFRISPGVTLYNGNKLNATASVSGGQEFDLGDSTNYSSTVDPIHGTATLNFGHKVAPSLTLGYGNMFARHAGHFSFQFEGGIEYTSAPTLTLNLAGSACQDQAQTMCGPVDQTDVRNEQNEINSDITLLRFFPIFNLGIGYRF